MSDNARYDLVISGAGMVGASLALAAQQAGLRIAVFEKRSAAACAAADPFDRASLIATGSVRFLTSLGVDPALLGSAVERMRVWDAEDSGGIHLDAEEGGEDLLGYIVENRRLEQALHTALEEAGLYIHYGRRYRRQYGVASAISLKAHGLTDEKTFDRRDDTSSQHPQVAQPGEAATAVGEEVTEGAASQYGDEIIRPPNALIAAQYGGFAPVFMMLTGGGDGRHQLFRITKSQIYPQTCQWMNAVGGIPQQYAALPDITAAVQARKRITAASSDLLEMPQLRSKRLMQFAQKPRIIQGHQVACMGLFGTPDDGGAGTSVDVVTERQYRQRAGGEESLIGDVAMRLFNPDGGGDGVLPIAFPEYRRLNERLA